MLSPDQLVQLRVIALDVQKQLERAGLAKLIFWTDVAGVLDRIHDRIGWLELLGQHAE